ncbi:MAG: DUF2807 domain-containing protein [Anaeromyxobacter sp.]|nr:DUF2807 domain-containing protein [Anaeromyxobacter sp.]MBL0277001.1 DUF2807 domain-containing protein [Anaeromyxobacter sp.]
MPPRQPSPRLRPRHLRPAAVATLALALAACDAHVEGNGVFAERTFDVAPFERVVVGLGIQATVAVGEDQAEAVITGDENVLGHVELQVREGTLITGIDVQTFTSVHPLRLRLAAPALAGVVAAAEARVSVTGAAAAAFTAEARGASRLTLGGEGGESLSLVAAGGSTVYATGYPVAGATVQVTGGSIALVHSSGPVTGTVAGGPGSSRVEVEGGGTCQAVVQAGSSCTPAGP